MATAVIDRPVWAPGPDDEDDVAVDGAGLARRLALSDRSRRTACAYVRGLLSARTGRIERTGVRWPPGTVPGRLPARRRQVPPPRRHQCRLGVHGDRCRQAPTRSTSSSTQATSSSTTSAGTLQPSRPLEAPAANHRAVLPASRRRATGGRRQAADARRVRLPHRPSPRRLDATDPRSPPQPPEDQAIEYFDAQSWGYLNDDPAVAGFRDVGLTRTVTGLVTSPTLRAVWYPATGPPAEGEVALADRHRPGQS